MSWLFSHTPPGVYAILSFSLLNELAFFSHPSGGICDFILFPLEGAGFFLKPLRGYMRQYPFPARRSDYFLHITPRGGVCYPILFLPEGVGFFPPFCPSALSPFFPSTVLPFRLSTLLPFRRSAFPPFCPSAVLPFRLSAVPSFMPLITYLCQPKIQDSI